MSNKEILEKENQIIPVVIDIIENLGAYTYEKQLFEFLGENAPLIISEMLMLGFLNKSADGKYHFIRPESKILRLTNLEKLKNQYTELIENANTDLRLIEKIKLLINKKPER